jgi:hypothetical protein
VTSPLPPQKHSKGQRQALDTLWLTHLTEGGDPGEGDQLANSPSFGIGIAEFNQGKFFEAHESFESAWLDAPYPDCLLGLALAKLGAACANGQRGNLASATKIVGDTLRYLAPLPMVFAGLDCSALRDGLELWTKSPHDQELLIQLVRVITTMSD